MGLKNFNLKTKELDRETIWRLKLELASKQMEIDLMKKNMQYRDIATRNMAAPIRKKMAECYQPLFDHLLDNYGIVMTISAMEDIVEIAEQVTENLREAGRATCDVLDCVQPVSSQGLAWSDSGYWCVCSDHASNARKGEDKPEMKKEAVDREMSRDKNGISNL